MGSLQGRAKRYLVGGELKNLGPLLFQAPPPKKNFPKSENVSGKCWPRGEGGEVNVLFPKTKRPKHFFKHYFYVREEGLNLVFQTFFDLNFPDNSLIFNTFRNSSIPGPPLRKLAPLFCYSLGGGGVTPPTPPSSSGPGSLQ
jgi:hypothetical protein